MQQDNRRPVPLVNVGKPHATPLTVLRLVGKVAEIVESLWWRTKDLHGSQSTTARGWARAGARRIRSRGLADVLRGWRSRVQWNGHGDRSQESRVE